LHAISYRIYIAIFPRKSAHAFSFITMQVSTRSSARHSMLNYILCPKLIYSYLGKEIRYMFFCFCFYICRQYVLVCASKKFSGMEWTYISSFSRYCVITQSTWTLGGDTTTQSFYMFPFTTLVVAVIAQLVLYYNDYHYVRVYYI